MSQRRLTPLIVLVVLAIGGLIARLYQVQIKEHAIWASEAHNLTRRARTIPYLRGEITDRNGDTFVKDEQAYAVQFVYREFRRHHPLGQIAHAWGALANESVSLQQAALELQSWGMALVEARAGEVEAFARGEAAEICGFQFADVEPGTERRRSRAAELRFYTHGLLDVSERDWKAITKDLKKGRKLDWTWLELVAERDGLPVDFVRARVERSLSRSMMRLEQIAVQMEVRSLEGLLPVSSEESLWFLIDGLEVKRREVESAIARDLFEEATGFEPGRLEPESLIAVIDLGFISDELGWNQARLALWAHEMREVWLEDRWSFHVPRAVIRARLREDDGEDALDAFLGELAVLFARKPQTPRESRQASRDWRNIHRPAVFGELVDLFERVEFEAIETLPLPFLADEWRDTTTSRAGAAELAAAMLPFEFAETVAREHPPQPFEDWRGNEQEPWSAPETLEDAVARVLWQLYPSRTTTDLAFVVDPSHRRDQEELLPWVQDLWEASFRSQLEEIFSQLLASAEARGFPMPLELSEKRLERARKKSAYFIRDRGSRPETIDDNPDDRVVNALTRYVEEYRGFEVEPRTRRLALALDEDDILVARELIGVVRESTLEEVLEQQPERSVFSRISAKKDRSLEEEERMRDLLGRLYRSDEVHGTSGIEGLMDRVLRGTNGYIENQGLQQREESSRIIPVTEKVDGLDIELTLSIDLQRAAQRTIEDPYLPLTENVRDEYWFRNPVGAIVLATVDGEILAAASGPKQPHEPSPARDGERAYNYERTLRMPLFQPPGSIFKPFVAVYALSRCGLHPAQEFECAVRDDGTAGWNKVACHRAWGHGAIALDEAIEVSCNAYFAQVGELLESKEKVRELAHLFGFDRPTGVRDVGGREGLVEVHRVRDLNQDRKFTLTDLNRVGNGLSVIEATPVQVARAVAGLATGRLPSMRLVRRIGEEFVPGTYEEIPLHEEAFEVVRSSMVGVINEGSAIEKGLDAKTLGFQLAGKTGSADYRPMTPAYLRELRIGSPNRPPQMRKHTWFVGFFPAENPTTVVVIYCHDIGVTASHSAVHVAAQFLKTPEVQAYARGAIR